MKTLGIAVACCASILITQSASAQYAEDALRFSQYGLGVGARNLGMGDASVGTVNDYTSLFWNPAGLALERDYEFSIGLSNNGLSNDATYLGLTQSASKNATNLNNIGFVYPIATTQGSLTFGFGFGRVSNFNNTASFNAFNPQSSIVESMSPAAGTDLTGLSGDALANILDNNLAFQTWLADTSTIGGRLLMYPLVTDSVQQSAKILEGGGVNHWSFGGALEIAKDLFVGASLNFVSGTYTYDRQYTEQDVKNVYHYLPPAYDPAFDFNNLNYESTITSDLSGFNALFGMMLKKQGKYQIGLAVRTPTRYEINETFTDDLQSSFKYGDSYEMSSSGKTSYSITTPFVFSAGLSVQALDWLVLAGDAEYTDWTQMQFNTDNADLIAENHYITSNMQPTWNLRGGAELTFWSLGLKLRGGYILNPSPYVGDPAKYDQQYLTGGIGYDLDNNVTLNGAYAYGWWSTFRNVYSTDTQTYSTSNEDVKSNNIIVSLSYRF